MFVCGNKKPLRFGRGWLHNILSKLFSDHFQVNFCFVTFSKINFSFIIA
jgi:hypothetical protein